MVGVKKNNMVYTSNTEMVRQRLLREIEKFYPEFYSPELNHASFEEIKIVFKKIMQKEQVPILELYPKSTDKYEKFVGKENLCQLNQNQPPMK